LEIDMKLAAFDLEIAKELPEGETDWKAHRPLGISCAAFAFSPVRMIEDEEIFISQFFGLDNKQPIPLRPKMTQDEAAGMVRNMFDRVEDGYTFVTVNGLAFDFEVLAEESGLYAECAYLALNHHCDLMLMSVCRLGWRTGLDAFAKGAGVESKLKSVTLSDGRVLEGMNGAKAPEMWAAGEYDAVLAYLKQDVKATLETAVKAIERGRLAWRSGSGKPYHVAVNGRLPTVAEMLAWPRPDVPWMDTPPDPDAMAAWTSLTADSGRDG
jgi:hypothetical protein